MWYQNTHAQQLVRYIGFMDDAYIDIENGVVTCSNGVVRFMWDPESYKPSLAILSSSPELQDKLQAQDILEFVSAYLERPDEFDRSSGDYEQTNRTWWETECRL